MRLQKNNGGFTLIELIVVITILAILGTIAFISLQGYSADARNSKRLSDMGQITTAMETKVVEGVSKIDTVTTVASKYRMTDVSLGWGATVNATNYSAWVPNYALLWIKQSEFSDPDGPEYLIGVTTIGGSRHQVVSKYEVDGSNKYKITGNYIARTTENKYGATPSATINDEQKTATIDDGLGIFKAWDVLVTVWKIASISDSQSVITFATGTGDPGADGELTKADHALKLATPESAGLVSTTDKVNAVIQDGDDY